MCVFLWRRGEEGRREQGARQRGRLWPPYRSHRCGTGLTHLYVPGARHNVGALRRLLNVRRNPQPLGESVRGSALHGGLCVLSSCPPSNPPITLILPSLLLSSLLPHLNLYRVCPFLPPCPESHRVCHQTLVASKSRAPAEGLELSTTWTLKGALQPRSHPCLWSRSLWKI